MQTTALTGIWNSDGFDHGLTATSTHWEEFIGFTYLLPPGAQSKPVLDRLVTRMGDLVFRKAKRYSNTGVAQKGLLLLASSLCLLLAGPLALYPGARLDQEFERDHLRVPHSELKQYFTSDSFDKVTAYYKKLAPEAAEWTINTKSNRRMAFRAKGDEKNSTTVEWSDEAGEDKGKTFILVNTAK